MAVPFCIPSNNEREFLFLNFLFSIGIISVPDFGHSNRCVVVSCCFNLHFPNDTWPWASFHMLIFHPHIFYSEVSVHIFHHFFVLFHFYFLSFFPALLRYNSHISERHKFKVCMLIWYTCIFKMVTTFCCFRQRVLANASIMSHLNHLFLWWEHLRSILLATFKYIIQ